MTPRRRSLLRARLGRGKSPRVIVATRSSNKNVPVNLLEVSHDFQVEKIMKECRKCREIDALASRNEHNTDTCLWEFLLLIFRSILRISSSIIQISTI